MRVLWSVNVVLPDVAKELGMKSGHAISWVDAMRNALVENHVDVELAIVCYGGIRERQFEKFEFGKVTYYILPFSFNYETKWDKIIEDFKPDVVHIYGTEKGQNLSLINKYKDKLPIIISLQGIITEYVKHYYANMSMFEILSSYTLRDVVFRNGIIAKKNAFWRQSKKEKKMLQTIKFVEGRSDWDKAISTNINSAVEYYYCPRMIRIPFWNYSWDLNLIEKYSIFVHQGDYPIKGLHFMIDALKIISKKYPNVKLYVSGNNIFQGRSKWIRGYTRFIRRKIEKYGLQNKIEFTGYLNAEELAEKLSKVNVCVIPSAIENAPNALAEAMIVGTPCIASYVGGNADMLNNGALGMLYCYYEPQLLAERLEQMFSDHEMAQDFSIKSQEYARIKHNPKSLEKRIKQIYADIIHKFQE